MFQHVRQIGWVLLGLSLVACRGSTVDEGLFGKEGFFVDVKQQEEAARAAEDIAMPASTSAAGVGGAPESGIRADRQVIYTADLRVEVQDFGKAVERIKSIVEAAGGFIANSSVDQSNDERRSGSVDLRVPKARFRDVMDDVKALGKVKHENLHGQDVTEEYTDLEARLSNAKQLEARILELLQRESKSLKDILEVEKELASVRGTIEQFEGRKRFLDDRLTLATINVSLFEPYAYTSSVFDPLRHAFTRAGSLLVASLAALVTVIAVSLPWLLIFGACGYFGARALRRWWRKKRGYK